jgi:DNA-binding response OmpR family regulator
MTNRRSLFVEHVPEILEFYSLHLEGAGYEVARATNFDEGKILVAATRGDPFDLVITNIGREKPNGISFCAGLRRDGLSAPT